ncbi:serine/threonine-protein kinase/endoribonuclease IRE1-like [Xenia sp. Carnegie-2017]|uniref:serine/threonine-protein kinase/endoribonuclease IRE1-like n=1 Tax=Xenia sp. Carnegie-2017 TaxID=2897299 RepID=UPI001F036AF4|nr:serine/threonine-protein kinase/endoribonuclease IRE1-like [Xenia sp. Carnegie-2017]
MEARSSKIYQGTSEARSKRRKPNIDDERRYTKFTLEEIEKISRKVAFYDELSVVLNIPYEMYSNCVNDLDPLAKSKMILEIFNEHENFDRVILNNFLKSRFLDLDKILSPPKQFDRESPLFSRLKSSETLYKDDLTIANYDIPSIGQEDLRSMPLQTLGRKSPPFQRSKSSVSDLAMEAFSSTPNERTSEAWKVRRIPNIDELVLQEWKYIDESTKHKELFLKLIEYGRNSSDEVKVVGNVRVIFSNEFCIGKGNDATRVYLGLDKDGYGKAVKRIHRDNYIQLALHEKKILDEFNARKSKYVVNYSFLEEETGKEYVYLILDLCEESLESFVESSTLHDLQNALPEILRQILHGLADLHSGPNPIIHRDLKPTNVLRDSQGKFLIADFGISRILNNDCTTYESKPNMGTEYWIAPESYCEDKDTVDKGRYKKESDVMNAGMVAYYIATKGKHPFGTKRHRLDNMLNGNPVGLDEIKDETLKDLLSWMLNRQPEDRPSATVALKHPFLMSDDEKFDLLCKVGNLQQIKTNDPLCSVVQQLNSESSDWKSKIDSDVYDYFRTDVVTGKIFTYDSSWTECLRLIRNINQHWNDRPRLKPQPEPFYKIGDHKAYILKNSPISLFECMLL